MVKKVLIRFIKAVGVVNFIKSTFRILNFTRSVKICNKTVTSIKEIGIHSEIALSDYVIIPKEESVSFNKLFNINKFKKIKNNI